MLQAADLFRLAVNSILQQSVKDNLQHILPHPHPSSYVTKKLLSLRQRKTFLKYHDIHKIF